MGCWLGCGNIGVTANRNVFTNIAQTLSYYKDEQQLIKWIMISSRRCNVHLYGLATPAFLNEQQIHSFFTQILVADLDAAEYFISPDIQLST